MECAVPSILFSDQKWFIQNQAVISHLKQKYYPLFPIYDYLHRLLSVYSWSMLYQYFQAIDRDHSGYITMGELGKLGNKMNQEKTVALMEKLDTNGDGKITLSEFRELFTHA